MQRALARTKHPSRLDSCTISIVIEMSSVHGKASSLELNATADAFLSHIMLLHLQCYPKVQHLFSARDADVSPLPSRCQSFLHSGPALC